MTSNSMFGERRNTLIALWDILFEENPKEWIGFTPALGLHAYPCYACKHVFSSVGSFQDHVNRRVIVLRYNCSYCSNQVFTFYNRCSFLLHTRNHYSLSRGEINLLKLKIFTLPVSLAGFLPHPNIPLHYSEQEEMVPDRVYINTQFYRPDIHQRGKQIITLKPSDLVFIHNCQTLVLKQISRNIPKCEFITLEQLQQMHNTHISLTKDNNNIPAVEINGTTNIKQEPEDEEQVIVPVISKVESLLKQPRCLDCNTYQTGTMAEHYLGNNKPVDSSLKCNTCRFVASTVCSLKAHVRIHTSTPPYVCPDCGKDFQTSLLLQKHMNEVCFHLAKHVRFRCPGKKCGKLFAMSTTFATHFQVHLKCFFTCSLCCKVLFKMEDTETHARLHEQPCSFANIYDCSVCTNLAPLTEDNFKEHINMHTTDTEKCMYAYLCRHCRSYFRSTATYATHILKCVANARHLTKCVAKQQKFGQVNRDEVSKYSTRNCVKCHNTITLSDDKSLTLCNKCKQQEQKLKAINTTTKRYYCILCNKQIMLEEKYLHMKTCQYSKARVVLSKLNLDDIQNNSFNSTASDTSSSSLKSTRKRSKSSESPPDYKKKRKRIYIPKIKKSDKGSEMDLTADEPIQFDGTYHCKLCNYTNTERLGFHEHIKDHRDISTAYQCMECGECFVVKPSLLKHLLHFHNISDHQSYLVNNDCYNVEAVKELEDLMRLAPGESKEPVNENQCRVCRKQFEDSTSLNKHFRIHGMAFLLKNSK